MTEEERKSIVDYRIKRANETLAEVSLLMENRLLHTAVNRIYYACFYAVIALLVKNDVKAQTHAGVRQMFGLKFIKTGIVDRNIGRFYSEMFDNRMSGDYDDFIEFSIEEVSAFEETARDLIKSIEELL